MSWLRLRVDVILHLAPRTGQKAVRTQVSYLTRRARNYYIYSPTPVQNTVVRYIKLYFVINYIYILYHIDALVPCVH